MQALADRKLPKAVRNGVPISRVLTWLTIQAGSLVCIARRDRTATY